MKKIYPGKVWLDTDGNRIQAHGGSVITVGDTFYWYGENKEYTRPDSGIWHNGVNVYSSKNLCEWKYEGKILYPTADFAHPLHAARLMDRPHILYHEKTEKFIMWIKLAGTKENRSDWNHSYMGVATSDSILGPFRLEKTFYPLGMSAGDFDLVKEETTRRAYVIFERVHSDMIIADLTDDYMDCAGRYSVHFPNGAPPYVREAPAYFTRNGKRYLFTSGTTGYYPNPTELATAEDMHGEWEILGNPCENDVDKNSFCAQFSSVFKHPFKEDLYIALGDRWLTDLPADMPNFWDYKTGKLKTDYNFYQATKRNTSLADYVWLPVCFKEDGTPYLKFRESWSPDEYKNKKERKTNDGKN